MDPVDVLISQVNEILSVPEGDDADLILEGEALLDELRMLLSSPHPRRFNLANAAVSLNEVCPFQTISFHRILYREGHDMDCCELTNQPLHIRSVSTSNGPLGLLMLNVTPARIATEGTQLLVFYVMSTSLNGPD